MVIAVIKAQNSAPSGSWFSFAGVSAANEKLIFSATFASRAKRAVRNLQLERHIACHAGALNIEILIC